MERSLTVQTHESEFSSTQSEDFDFEDDSAVEKVPRPPILRLRRCLTIGDEQPKVSSKYEDEPGVMDFPAGKFNVGRSVNADLVLGDHRVSELHAILEIKEDGELLVKDNSENGIGSSKRLQGEGPRLTRGKWEKVPIGAKLCFDPNSFQFYVEEVVAAQSAQGGSCEPPSTSDGGGKKRARDVDEPLRAPRVKLASAAPKKGHKSPSSRRAAKKARNDELEEDNKRLRSEVDHLRVSVNLGAKHAKHRFRVDSTKSASAARREARAAGGVKGVAPAPVCWDFTQGQCQRGFKCKFRHALDGGGPKPGAYQNRKAAKRGLRRSS